MKLARSFLPLTFPIFQPTHMAYTIYFSTHLTNLSSSSHFQSSHVSSIFSGLGALFSLFSHLFLIFFFCIFSLTRSHRLCLMPSSRSFFFFPFFFISSFFSSRILCYNFFLLDFSSKFVWHKNFEGVSDIA